MAFVNVLQVTNLRGHYKERRKSPKKWRKTGKRKIILLKTGKRSVLETEK